MSRARGIFVRSAEIMFALLKKSSDMKILFLEDTEVWIERYKTFLEEYFSDDITHYPSGGEALLELEQTKFDVIICDHQMPGMNGDRVYGYARYKKHSQNKETPFIHFSSSPCSEKYKGYDKDSNFYMLRKDWELEPLWYLLTDLNFKSKKEGPDES